jgi:ABC-type transporter Mla MlaB component
MDGSATDDRHVEHDRQVAEAEDDGASQRVRVSATVIGWLLRRAAGDVGVLDAGRAELIAAPPMNCVARRGRSSDGPRRAHARVRLRGPIGRADLPGLCGRVCALLQDSDAGVVLCDVSGVDPDAVTVDALARLQLAARSHRCSVLLRNASPELIALVAFMGLDDVLVSEGAAAGRTAGTRDRCRERT